MRDTILRHRGLGCGKLGLALSVSLFLASGLQVTGKEQNPPDEKETKRFPVIRYGARAHGFRVTPKLEHNLRTRQLTTYSLIFNPVLEETDDQIVVHLFFDEVGEFHPAVRPHLPGVSHVQIVIDGKPSAEFKVTVFGGCIGGSKLGRGFGIQISRALFAKLAQADKVCIRVYWRSVNGENVKQNDLRTFDLDARSRRTIAKLLVGGKAAGPEREEDIMTTEKLRQGYIETKKTQEEWLRAKKAWVNDLKSRYGGIDASVRGKAAVEHDVRFSRLMREWNPIHCSSEDLKAIAGKPTTETENVLEYMFDNGWDGSGWRFRITGGTILVVEYIPGE